MAQEAFIDGNLINDDRPLAVEAQANSGVDVGDVTVNNDVGAAAVNIQDGGNDISIDDGGNSITVDGAVTSTPAASELHIGQVGGEGITIAQTPTVTVGAYSANEAVGGLLTFAGAARVATYGGVIKNVLIIDDAGQDAVTELWLFDVTFTAMADNAAWAPSQADLRNLVCVVSTNDSANGWAAAGTLSVCSIECSYRFDATGTSLFGQLVTRGTPTEAATDDITVQIGILQD